jgi:hypothetical protein
MSLAASLGSFRSIARKICSCSLLRALRKVLKVGRRLEHGNSRSENHALAEAVKNVSEIVISGGFRDPDMKYEVPPRLHDLPLGASSATELEV